MTDRPLVSFLQTGFNQERVIREAVEGALAQSYSPLEVILSDDASTDGTFDIMRECAAAYRGPHRVVLNRNDENLGICGHVSRLATMASGALLVFGGGDDIALPGRTAACVEAFERNPGTVAVTCRTRLIDTAGAPITELDRQSTLFSHPPAATREARVAKFIRTFRPGILGCVLACDRKLFDLFGPIDGDLTLEDLPLGFRAHLAGEMRTVDEVGVLYRLHDPDEAAAGDRDPLAWARGWLGEGERRRWFSSQAALYPVMERDLRTARELGLVAFSIDPHVGAMRRRAEMCRLLAAQGDLGAAGRAGVVMHLLSLAPGPRTLAAACLRVLPRRAVESLRARKRRIMGPAVHHEGSAWQR